MKKLDFGYGNPTFIQELYEKNIFSIHHSSSLAHYDFAKHPSEKLKKQILDLHKKEKNVQITSNTKIIITVGAVQAVQIVMAYYQQKNHTIHLPIPYWGRFDLFIKNLGLTTEKSSHGFSFITSPNNPDGFMYPVFFDTEIHDACYNWSIYTDNVIESKALSKVFSFGKLTGFASTRIGWIVTDDVELEKFAIDYVNNITSGVSIESQMSASLILNFMNNYTILEQSKNILKNRRILLKNLFESKGFSVLSHEGMFLYVQANPEFFQELNIEVVSGDFFNDNPNHFRLNLGVSTEDFKELCNRLKSI